MAKISAPFQSISIVTLTSGGRISELSSFHLIRVFQPKPPRVSVRFSAIYCLIRSR